MVYHSPCLRFWMDLLVTSGYSRAMDVTKVSLGLLLLAVSSVILFATSPAGTGLPIVAIGVASLGMAAGALLVGTNTEEGRPV